VGGSWCNGKPRHGGLAEPLLLTCAAIDRLAHGVHRLLKQFIEVDAVRLVCATSMDPTADLETSLAFVIGRIEEEATRSGEPLSDEERALLNDLPTTSVVPMWYGSDPESLTVTVPRDTAFERLCALARSARNSDARLIPTSALNWEFAAAVSKLNHHPMSWLLRWAGVKVRRPWWDRWLLVLAALLVIFSGAGLLLLAGNPPWTLFQRVGFAAGYAAVLLPIYFASRRLEEWQLKRNIERCRHGSSFTVVT
jgi:hypothetical protein